MDAGELVQVTSGPLKERQPEKRARRPSGTTGLWVGLAVLLGTLVVSLGVIPWVRPLDVGFTVGSRNLRVEAFRIDADRGSPFYEFRLRRSTTWSERGVRYTTEEFRLGRIYYAFKRSAPQ